MAGRTAEGEGGPQAGIYGCSEAAGSMRRMDRSKKRLQLLLPMLGQAGGSGGQGNGVRREGGEATNSPPSCTASKRVPAQGLSTPAKCTRGAPRHSIPLFKRRKPRSGRKRARRQGRPSRPRSDEDRGARREADVARRAAATVHYQPSSLRTIKVRPGAETRAPPEPPGGAALSRSDYRPFTAGSHLACAASAKKCTREGRGRERERSEREDSGTAARTDLRGSPSRQRDVFARLPHGADLTSKSQAHLRLRRTFTGSTHRATV